MTLLHFINCVAAAYSPYFIAYRFSGLSEYSAFWKCIRAGASYIVTQIVKMLVLATVFPVGASEDDKRIFFVECLKCSVELLDMLGLYLVMTRVLGRSEMKVMITSVGWGTAELLGTKIIPLWVGARGVEFRWINLQTALDANLNLLFLMIVCMLLWLWSRKDLNHRLFPFLATLLTLLFYRSVLVRLLQFYCGLDHWHLLYVKFGLVCILGTPTLHMYTTMSPPKL